MRFVCDSCRAQYMISDDKVGPKGVKVRCKKCGHVILVRKTQDSAPAAAPDAGDDEERDATQVMSNPLASLGASLDQELTNPGAAAPAQAKAEPDPNSLLGASDDEIGAVFDSVLNSGVQKIPGAEDEVDEKTQVAGGNALGDDGDDRMSTRVLDADTMKKLAAEAGIDGVGAKAPGSNGEAKNGDAKKDTDHDWYVAIDEKQVGPLKKEVVKEKWEAGEISADSLCWRAGFSDWIPVSEAAELASVLAPRPSKPMIVGNTMPQPSVVSVPVESAFSSGGVTRTVRSEMQVPMAASPTPTPDDAPGGWKPSAASALASLVRDEMDSLDKPSTPPPSAASSGEGAMAMGGGLLDLPSQDEPKPHSGANGRSTGAHSPLFDEPAPAPAQHRTPMNGNTGGYAPQPMQQSAYPQPYAPYPMPPAQGGGNKTLLIVGGGVLVLLLLVIVGGGVYIATRPPAVAVPVQQDAVAMNQQLPKQVVKPPVEAAKVEEKVVPPKVEEKPAEKAPEVAKAAVEEKKPEEKPVEKVADKGVDMPQKKPNFVASNTPKKVAKVESGGDDDVGTISAGKKEEPAKKIAEPKGTDDEFAQMFGGGESKKKSNDVESTSAKETPKKKSDSVWIPPAPGQADANVQEKLGQSDITQGILGNLPAIKKCIGEQKAKDPSLSGPIVMRFTIQPTGKVSKVSVGSDEHKSSYLGACLGGVIKSTSFPKHKVQGPEVNFPFKF